MQNNKLQGGISDPDDQNFRAANLQNTKKLEELQERVQDSTKVLEIELKLFRQEKEAEMRYLLAEFVRL